MRRHVVGDMGWLLSRTSSDHCYTPPGRIQLSPRPVPNGMVGSCRVPHANGGRRTMYETRFGLRQRPFPATPDSACYYPATGHERALARRRHAIDDQQGLVLLTGEPGTGKTLLGHCLLEGLGPAAASAFLASSRFRDRTALLQAILYDLSLPYEQSTEQELRLRLTDFL